MAARPSVGAPTPRPALLVIVPAVLLAAALFAFAAPARAHDWAMSRFEARTDERGVALLFRLDSLGVREALGDPAADTATILRERQERLGEYFFSKFAVLSDGKPCTAPGLVAAKYDTASDKVLVSVAFDCGGAPTRLTIRSELLLDVASRHELIGELQHGAARENYFFNPREHEATVDLAVLDQSLPEEVRRRALGAAAASARPAGSGARAPSTTSEPSSASRASSAAVLGHYVLLGLEHILSGFDHVLFVLTLVTAVLTWRRLALVITSFTVAHSLTLVAVALGAIRVSPAFVEPVIALSIAVVAALAIARPSDEPHAGLTFGFGLFHGLGFGATLGGLAMQPGDVALALFGFNVGVELGQLAIVLPLFPLVVWLRRREVTFRRVHVVALGAVAALALTLAVWRVVG